MMNWLEEVSSSKVTSYFHRAAYGQHMIDISKLNDGTPVNEQFMDDSKMHFQSR
jgi:hypothetical protein